MRASRPSRTSNARQSGPAESAAEEIRKAGRKALLLSADVSDQSAVETMVANMVAELGGIDIFISSAAYSDREPFHTANMAGFRKTIEVSLFGAYYCLRACTNQMLKQGRGGRIINVCSVLGERAIAHAAAYCAAQAGVMNLTRALATEWGPQGVTVNALAQGWMDYTPLLGDPDPAVNKTVRFVPMKRAGAADELGPLAVYLASDSCGYISGQVLFVDGGLTTHL